MSNAMPIGAAARYTTTCSDEFRKQRLMRDQVISAGQKLTQALVWIIISWALRLTEVYKFAVLRI